jgi:hypothetical protein
LGELLPRASGCCTRPWPSANSLGWVCCTGAGGGRVETAAASAYRVCGAGGRKGHGQTDTPSRFPGRTRRV